MEIIKVSNLTFEYHKKQPILNDISFAIQKGTIMTILGLNGSGKSTLIKLIAGLNKATNGTILLNDKLINNYSDNERSKLIAYVPQMLNVNVELNVMEFLLLSLTNKKNIFWKPTERDISEVMAFIEKLNIDNNIFNKQMNELSGGQRQIITIAAALLQDTEIIILDEPTAALDMKNQYVVLHFLKKLCKESNKTIVFSTHDPNHALRLGGNVIILSDNKILFSGKCRENITPSNLKKIYGDNVVYASESKHKIITLGDF